MQRGRQPTTQIDRRQGSGLERLGVENHDLSPTSLAIDDPREQPARGLLVPPDSAQADGVLEVVVPKAAPETKVRTIPVTTA